MNNNSQHDSNQSSRNVVMNSPSKSRKQILQSVFENENYQDNYRKDENENRSDEKLNNMMANLLKMNIQDSINQEVSQNVNENEESPDNNEDVNIQLLFGCYKAFLQKIANDDDFAQAHNEQKIQSLLEIMNQQENNEELSIGASIFLFEIVYKFKLEEEQIGLILQVIFDLIGLFIEQKNYYMVICILEIVIVIGPHEISLQNINKLISIIMDDNLKVIKELAVLALQQLDYPGLFALYEISNRDQSEDTLLILNKLVQNEEIISKVIIPVLLNDLGQEQSVNLDFYNSIGKKDYSQNQTSQFTKRNVNSLACLNRLTHLNGKAEILNELVQLLGSGSVDRQLTACTIRSCGNIGEKILVRILQTTNDDKIKQSILSVLFYRVLEKHPIQLQMEVVPYSVSQHYKIPPGNMFMYIGNLYPLCYQNLDNTDVLKPMFDRSNNTIHSSQMVVGDDTLYLLSRDLLIGFMKLLNQKQPDYQKRGKTVKTSDIKLNGLVQQMHLVKFIDPDLFQSQSDKPEISPATIRILQNHMFDKNIQIRETALNTLGTIGLPETIVIENQLIRSLDDREPQIRALGAWCLGRLGQFIRNKKVGQCLLKLLRDNFWKVRTTACVSLGNAGQTVRNEAFPVLKKMLVEGQSNINKHIICETIVRLGQRGEGMLVEMMKSVGIQNVQLRSAIIQSLHLIDLMDVYLDQVLQIIFLNIQDPSVQIRKSCLKTLEILRQRCIEQNIQTVYLNSSTLLPLLYTFLQDSSNETREQTLSFIVQFESESELILQTGLNSDRNHIVRNECIKGLAMLGTHNFRDIIRVGFRDQELIVRNTTEQVVVQFYTVQQIFIQYQNDQPFIEELKDILRLPYELGQNCLMFIQNLIYQLEQNQPMDQQ